MLGLVAMATNVDSLYAAMKAMVCIVGNNTRALKEMERTGGFQVYTCTCTCIPVHVYYTVLCTCSINCIIPLVIRYVDPF